MNLVLVLVLLLVLFLVLALVLVLVLVLSMTLTLTQTLTLTLTPTLTLNQTLTRNLNLNLNPNLIPNPNPNPNLNLSPEVLIRSCNKCNYIKPPTDFDESKYTCRSCTSAKVNCLYCASVVRYDGIRAHVKKQHPDVDIPKGFSRNLSEKTINPRWQSKTVCPLVISQTEESCSCKYYNFVSFLINNGLNIEKKRKYKFIEDYR